MKGEIPLVVLIAYLNAGQEDGVHNLSDEDKLCMPDTDLTEFKSVRFWVSKGALHYAFDKKEA